MITLRRKKRSPTVNGTSEQTLRHSLSLPDLTTPLIDAASWEEIPAFAAQIPSLPNTKPGFFQGHQHHSSNGTTTTPRASMVGATRHRTPSLIGGTPGSPVPFHRPVNHWQLVTPLDGKEVDFRRGVSGWSRDSQISTLSNVIGGGASAGYGAVGGSMARRRKGKGKGRVAEKLNVMVVGGKGVGKTSFVNMLLDSLKSDSSHAGEGDTPPTLHHDRLSPILPDPRHHTPSSPTSPGPPMLSPPITSPMHPPPTHSKPCTLLYPAPTSRALSHTLVFDRPGEKIDLRLIDTPGLDLAVDGDLGIGLHARARERGVGALLRIAEQRFEEILREEAKVVRRQLSGGGDLIHLCVYLIDARAVLRPPQEEAEVDWSALSLVDVDVVGAEKLREMRPQLHANEIDVVRRLSKRMSVLPVLTQRDAVTERELSAVKEAVQRDLASAFGDDEGKGFGTFWAEDEDVKTQMADVVEDDESMSPDPANPRDPRPLTPASTVRSHPADNLPYAIFSPERPASEEGEAKPSGGRLVRQTAWGTADVLNPHHSDFGILRGSILDTHAKALRTSTREVLYEKYRTEQLLAKRARLGVSEVPED